MKTIFALLLLLAISSCKSDNQYFINGTIDNEFNNEWIYLTKFMEPEPMIDSTLVKNGKFSFKGIVDYPELYVLNNNSDSDFRHFAFFLEPAKMKIEINLDDWTWGSNITGGPINDEYNREYRTHEIEAVKLNRETEVKMVEADSAKTIELEKIQREFQNQLKQRSLDYISNHPDSPISPYLLGQMFFGIPFDESQKILNGFSEENKRTSICLSLQERLDLMIKFKDDSLESK
jgi:hypothetical protein